MPPTTHLLRTPTDFERTMADAFVQDILFSPNPQIEAGLREAREDIFRDLALIDKQDPQMVSAYLEGIAAPLEQLHALGITIFALGPTTGKWGDMTISLTHYLIVPQNARFRVGEDMDGAVHRFDPQCQSAATDLMRAIVQKIPIVLYALPDAAVQAYERNVPWCEECCLGDMQG